MRHRKELSINGGFMKKVDLGIEESDIKELTVGLSRVLAETYTLYLQTQNFHWNVTGPLFAALHPMFGEQYAELATSIDVIAERIRTLGQPAPATFLDFQELSSIKETREQLNATKMIECLSENHEKLIKLLRTISKHADSINDEGTLDLVVSRIATHEKTAWMLRSSLTH